MRLASEKHSGIQGFMSFTDENDQPFSGGGLLKTFYPPLLYDIEVIAGITLLKDHFPFLELTGISPECNLSDTLLRQLQKTFRRFGYLNLCGKTIFPLS